jgi:hypothetical protein
MLAGLLPSMTGFGDLRQAPARYPDGAAQRAIQRGPVRWHEHIRDRVPDLPKHCPSCSAVKHR